MARPDVPPPAEVRLDVWLDVACLYRTRSEAQRACKGGKVHLNGQAAKPHRTVRVGDELRLTRSPGRRQIVAVAALADHHLPRAEARHLYEDRTPPPSPDEVAVRELERHFWTSRRPTRVTPDRRERRRLRQVKEDGGA